MDNKKWFQRGIKNGLPICMGYFAVSFAFGIQAVEGGLTVFQAGVLSLLNVTSAGQFAGLSVIIAGGSYIEMAVLQLIINLRYLLMSTALSQKLTSRTGTLARLGIAYGVTDEIFGVSVLTDGELNPFYSYGLTAISVLGWTGGTVFGAAAGAILPESAISALGIALYGMFIAIIIPPATKSRPVLMAVLGGMFLSTAAAYAPLIRELSEGMQIIIITVLVASVCAVIWPVKEREEG